MLSWASCEDTMLEAVVQVTDLPSERWTALSGKPSPSTASGSSTSRFTSEEESTTSSETQRDFRSQPFFEDPWHGYHELIEEDWQAWTEDFRRRQQAYSGACPPRDGPRPPTSSALEETGGEPRRRQSRLPASCLIETPNTELTMARPAACENEGPAKATKDR
ncbi:unnamed protein product [Durusdinium trenchii]|uniref:Uncharacterized protein n=1 Tax=Durusdinium trenchii TaxID=1381693 RepID=A0ABP0NG04_9DINO